MKQVVCIFKKVSDLELFIEDEVVFFENIGFFIW